MKLEKCEDINAFVHEIQNIAQAEEAEWQGRKVSAGEGEAGINLDNIRTFLELNSKYWKKSRNPKVGKHLTELADRIIKEYPAELESAKQVKEVAAGATLPKDIIKMVLPQVPRKHAFGSEAKLEFKSTKAVSKEWKALTEDAKIEWFNNNPYRWADVLTAAQLVEYAVKCGPKLKVFNPISFYDRYSNPKPFSQSDYMRIVAACPNLENVCLAGEGATDAAVQAVCTHCSQLKELSFQDAKITRLPETLPDSLKALHLFTCMELTGLPGHLPRNLESLKMHQCHGISEIPQLPAPLKELEINSTFIQRLAELPGQIQKILALPARNFSPEAAKLLSQYGKDHPGCDLTMYG